MAWIAVGTMVVGAAMNAKAQSDKQDQLARYNQGQAEMTKYSPWTGISGKTEMGDGSSTASAAFQGGMAGLNFAQGIKGAQKPTGDAVGGGAGGVGALGSGKMTAELGSMGQDFKPQQSIYEQMKPQGGMGMFAGNYQMGRKPY